MNIDAKKRRQRRINELKPSHQSWQEWHVPPTRNRFLYKCLICLCVYGLVWTIFQFDEQVYAKRAQDVIKSAMNDSFNYEAITLWYQAHIGVIPTLLPIFDDRKENRSETEYIRPVAGHPEKTTINEAGVMEIHTSGDRAVTSIGRGLVQYVATIRPNEMIVKVLYSDGILAIFAGLEFVQVQKNDWLEEGTLIGHTNILYFALMKGEQYVNPGDVIPFD